MFYLECDKGRENNVYQVYIIFCYVYVLIVLFFYKVIILSFIFSNVGLESAFYHMTVTTIKREQQGGRHEIWDLQKRWHCYIW